MSANFRRAHEFTNVGGETIHHSFLKMEKDSDYNKELTDRLFKTYFWDAAGCEKMPLPMAIVLYDGVVSMDLVRSVILLQMAINIVAHTHLDHYVPIAEDSINGPKTHDIADYIAVIGMEFYTAREAVRLREKFYRELIRRRPDLEVFIKGWINRCTALANYLAQVEREMQHGTDNGHQI